MKWQELAFGNIANFTHKGSCKKIPYQLSVDYIIRIIGLVWALSIDKNEYGNALQTCKKKVTPILS